MEVFRLSREQYAGNLSGMGAALRGARWNSVGVELLYTAANCSLAMAEVAVHLTLATLPPDFRMVTLEVSDDVPVLQLETSDLPANWNVFPHVRITQAVGDKFVWEGKYGVLRIPSVVTKGDYNYLINPYHADFQRIRIVSTEPFPFDKRIIEI
jgi:RES domain-containing protein